ncbi:hypothetical protein K2173_001960 [Erythroxylum novogranatense]|uniref:Pentatricopeptide repeat-containing protein n=1 Tax=Erythroxylum novogranatense TaxID=1862640 RepID=A0AAV8SP53_9ROSI|nr:hypothetical protein K2173_001960 [Erythroxylum novogranatense]
MRELVILGSSSIVSPSNTSSTPYPHHHQPPPNPKPKTKPPVPNPSSSTLQSRTPFLSSPVRGDSTTRRSSLLNYYAHLASRLAGDGHLHDFAMVAESVIASGIDVKQFVAALSLAPVASGISRNLREGNVENVVEVLRRVEQFGIPPLKLFDEVVIEDFKSECVGKVKSGEVEELVDLTETLSGFGFLIKELVEPDTVIKLCIEQRKPKLAVRYVCVLPRERILFCTIISEFGHKGDLDSALVAYEAYKGNCSVPNMYVYRTIIDVCGRCGGYMKSRHIYEDLLNQKITPNIYVFNSLMNVNAHDLGYTLHIYKNMQDLGVKADVATYNILLKACCLAGRVDLAQDIYREVKQLESTGLLKLDVFTYCTIIKVFANAKLWQTALKIKEDMLSSGVKPNTYTWSSLISACANAGLVEQAIQLFEEMIQSGCKPNSQCCNILLHACVEACQYDRAFRLFNSWKGTHTLESFTEDADSNKFNILTADDSGSNVASDSYHLHFIKKLPFTPTSTTYNILMKACGSDFHHAKAIMDEMKSVGLSPNHISWSILIDICGSSGNVEGALQTLKHMRMAGVEPDVVAYTTAIKVCVENKKLKQAFLLFAEMKRYQIKPNLVTYNTLLRARTRYGSLQEVQQCLSVYQDMRKAGYKSNDYYLKQLLEEWCEGVIQDNNKSQEFASSKGTELGRPHSLLLEKVAAYLQSSVAESLVIDLHGLTKVEARIVVLAVLRMIKENHTLGQCVEDDVWITLGGHKSHPAENTSEVKDAICELLENELGLEIFPKFTVQNKADSVNSDDRGLNLAGKFKNRIMVSPTRRPIGLPRLKVTRKSLQDWLQRRPSENI